MLPSPRAPGWSAPLLADACVAWMRPPCSTAAAAAAASPSRSPRGATVTVVDVSIDALATLRRRAAEAGVADRVIAVQGDVEALAELVPAAAFDLVLAHGILEVVEAAAPSFAAIAAAVRPGGLLSVLVSNPVAAVLGRALAGDLAGAERELALLDTDQLGPDTVRPALRRARAGRRASARHRGVPRPRARRRPRRAGCARRAGASRGSLRPAPPVRRDRRAGAPAGPASGRLSRDGPQRRRPARVRSDRRRRHRLHDPARRHGRVLRQRRDPQRPVAARQAGRRRRRHPRRRRRRLLRGSPLRRPQRDADDPGAADVPARRGRAARTAPPTPRRPRR